MGREFVSYVVEEGMAIVTINHPPANALDNKTTSELDQVFDELAADEGVKVIILTGAGEKIFVAGADITLFPEMDQKAGEEFSRKLQEAFDKIESLEKVVICAVNGVTLGGGCELAMSCDIRVASENARFGQPEVNLGVIPGAGGTQRLPRLVPKGKAKELIFTGDMISAPEAKEIGLVDRMVSKGEAVSEAKKIAKKIMGKGPIAIKYAKKAIDEGVNMTLSEGLKLERRLFGELFGTEDQKEGAKAFLEKREAQFKGK
ncbi:MAG: enoyl-CoA hydratase-related protein [Thermodesulfobacteriota bacterium]|nr:enoyl-CoA hydratase-related protein [Thermodesulfobacteriota bacterium]